VRSGLLALGCALAVLAAPACERGEGSPADPPPSPEIVPAAARKESRERPLPAFDGFTLEGEKREVSDFLGRRLLIFFFNPEFAGSEPVAQAVAAVAELQGPHNFAILGVGVGSGRERLEAFVAAQGLAFPVLDDSTAAITQKLRLRSRVGLLVTDAEGFLEFGMNEFPESDGAAAQVEALLRRALRLPLGAGETQPLLGTRPAAPDFDALRLDGEGTFRLSQQRGRSVVLIFFLHTCPHCHDVLGTLKEVVAALPEDKRPVVAGIEITGRRGEVRLGMKEKGLDYFPVLFDDDGSIREAYGVFAGVPDTLLIDAEGRIAARMKGWKDAPDRPLLRMRVARLAGAPVPMLLRSTGYSGNEVCGVCHEVEYETWSLTTHATAFDTLVKHGVEDDAECIGCHVVGHGAEGGFEDAASTPYLENVGCETCHGRGGPHLSGPRAEGFESTCVGCHDAKHSLGFDYATFLPIVSHAANVHLASLPLEEKQKLLAERGRPRDALLPTNAAYVGSDACRGCHPAEYATWASGDHAGAMATLEARGEAGSGACLACHTTGYGKPGGLPEGAAVGAHPDLARVGCESCHGPGGAHVAEDAVKLGSIVSLGDKCDSCVILQICGSCHDDANDPGFEFEVQEKIEAQRHGTIEAGTGKPLGRDARAPATRDAELLARAFERLDAGG